MKEKLTIVKMGGNVIDDESLLSEFVSIFGQMQGQKLLVHGGGKIATKTATLLGIETRMVEGRRITGDEMIDVAVMVYAGLVNKKIVALLAKEGVTGLGLTGADGNCILAEKRSTMDGIDYGWVGDVKKVNSHFLSSMLGSGITPILCAITHDGRGHMLNTNADAIAGEVAIALCTHYDVSLNYCFELNGVLRDVSDPHSLIKQMDRVAYRQLQQEGVIAGGMIPKLDNAFKAMERGVSRVNILNVESLKQIENEDYDAYTTLH